MNVDNEGSCLVMASGGEEMTECHGQQAGNSGLPPLRYSIVGTWDDWQLHDMHWDVASKCFTFHVTLGCGGRASFCLLLDGDRRRCICPESRDAGPREGGTVLGVGDGCDDARRADTWWTIGRRPEDGAFEGARYEVRLVVTADGRPSCVSWEPLRRQKESDATTVSSLALAKEEAKEAAAAEDHFAVSSSREELEPGSADTSATANANPRGGALRERREEQQGFQLRRCDVGEAEVAAALASWPAPGPSRQAARPRAGGLAAPRKAAREDVDAELAELEEFLCSGSRAPRTSPS